jgi:hypothetical protein
VFEEFRLCPVAFTSIVTDETFAGTAIEYQTSYVVPQELVGVPTVA